MAQEPGAQDVAAWFTPAIAGCLERAGFTSIADVVTRIKAVGQRWWTVVPGVGDLKASRIVDFRRPFGQTPQIAPKKHGVELLWQGGMRHR